MDVHRMMRLNPAILARRLVEVEKAVERQFALNDAAASKLLAMQDELAQKGAFIVALLQKLGGRFEITLEELRALGESHLRANFAYPCEERQTFVMVLSADGTATDEQRKKDIETRLRAAGMSDEEIASFARQLDDAAADAERTFGEPPEDAKVDPAAPGEERTVSAIVGPDGAPLAVAAEKPPEGA